MKKKQDKLTYKNQKELEEFYTFYPFDFWLYKTMLLKNVHDNFRKIKPMLLQNLEDVKEKEYKRFLRTELHFEVWHALEALFELFFACLSGDNRNLWAYLSFSKNLKLFRDKSTYENIKELSENKINLAQKISLDDGQKISLLHYVFYFNQKLDVINTPKHKKNLEKIAEVLRFFARRFTDRYEYNAYKHSLRFYNQPFSLSVGKTGNDKAFRLGGAKDAITFLEVDKKNQIRKTTKPFNVEVDFRFCVIAHGLISNIIMTRRASMTKERFDLYTFNKVDTKNLCNSELGINRFSITI